MMINKTPGRQIKAIVEIGATLSARKALQQAKAASHKRAKREPVKQAPLLDATPERLAMEPDAEMIIVGDEVRTAGTVLVRRFRSTHLDRLHKKGQIDLAQWTAGDWYRNKHDEGHSPARVTAKYGEHVPGGEPSYGLARTEAQLRSRQDWVKARSQWTREQQGFMDRLLIRDEYPRYGGSKAMRNIAFMRRALDVMAEYLRG